MEYNVSKNTELNVNVTPPEIINAKELENSVETVSIPNALKLDTPKPSASSSKLDNLSHDDLIACVKKQFISLSNARKQIEQHKAEIVERDRQIEEFKAGAIVNSDDTCNASISSKINSTDMISMELLDFKQSLKAANIALKNSQHEVTEKDKLLVELTTKFNSVSEERENALESLRNSKEKIAELQKILKEKTTLISEKSKEIDMTVVQMSELKKLKESEFKELNNLIVQNNEQLIKYKRVDLQNSLELKQVKSELEFLKKRYDDQLEEHLQFKERAQYVLKKQQENDGDNSSPNNQNANTCKTNEKIKSTEIQELIETLQFKNDQISTLTNKCSVLNEDLKISQQHIASLEKRLKQINTQIATIQSQEALERNNLKSKLEQQLEVGQCEIDRLKAKYDKLTKQTAEEKELLKKEAEKRYASLLETNATISDELAKLKINVKNNLYNKMSERQSNIEHDANCNVPTNKDQSSNNFENNYFLKQQQEVVKNTNNLNSFCSSSATLCGNQLPKFGVPNGENQINESDNEDLLYSLQCVIKEAETECPPSNPCSVDESLWKWGNGGVSNKENNALVNLLQEKLEKSELQLSHNRDLLAELEQANVRLMEQVELLKKEMRRVEHNMERNSHVTNNSEYLKNVILKFLSPQKVLEERQQLLPILRTILKLSVEECVIIEKAISATPFTLDGEGGGGATKSQQRIVEDREKASSNWLNYISSMF